MVLTSEKVLAPLVQVQNILFALNALVANTLIYRAYMKAGQQSNTIKG
jgi:hypothetical protein